MKKIIFSLTFILLAMFSLFSANATLYKYGDVSCDGKISIADATLIQKYLVYKVDISSLQKSIADVNADGKVNILDATCIQMYVSGIVSGFKSGVYYDDKGEWLPGEFD